MRAEPARVVYCTPSGQVGGAERGLIRLLEHLDRDRFAPEVWVGSPGPFFELLAASGTPAELVAMPGALRRMSRFHANPWAGAALALVQTPVYLAGLQRRLRRAGASLVHCNGIKPHILAALLPATPPLVWHLRDYPPRDAAGRETAALRLMRHLRGRPAGAIADTHDVAAAWAAALPGFQNRMRVIYNGVDVAAFAQADGAARRASWGLGPNDIVIGMIGIFAPWKGQEVFLRAAQRARAARPDLRFVLVGDDVYDTAGHGGRRAELKALAAELGLGDTVRFTGFLKDGIPEAYAALDVMVHASTRPEPFGLTVIEAMAAGVPTIAAAAGGPREIIRGEDEGVLTPPGDVDALAAAMLDLAGDANRRSRLAAGGRARVASTFTAAAHAAAVMELYAAILN